MNPLVSPRGSRTGELLNLDVSLQVKLSPTLVQIRDQCLRRGPIGFLHLADASGLKAKDPAIFMEPDRYRNLLSDIGMRISKEDGQSLAASFCDPRGYFRITLFYERVIAIFYGERRARAEKFFEILSEGRKQIALTRTPVASSEWDSSISSERREFSLLTFCGLMAGVSVVTSSDEEFDDILRSFQPVLVSSSTSFSSGTEKKQQAELAAKTAHLFEQKTQERVQQRSSPSRVRQQALLKDHQKEENCPKYVAGFMGHISCASEHFGKTHYETMRQIPKLSALNQERHEQEVRDAGGVGQQTMAIKYRGGNKSNFHNFSLS